MIRRKSISFLLTVAVAALTLANAEQSETGLQDPPPRQPPSSPPSPIFSVVFLNQSSRFFDQAAVRCRCTSSRMPHAIMHAQSPSHLRNSHRTAPTSLASILTTASPQGSFSDPC